MNLLEQHPIFSTYHTTDRISDKQQQ